jgi:cell division protein FtsX
MTKYALLIFKNLLRSKRRTILTIISIAVSLFIFALLVSLPTFVNQVLADTSSTHRTRIPKGKNLCNEAQAPTAEMAETPPSIKKSAPTTYAESSDAR